MGIKLANMENRVVPYHVELSEYTPDDILAIEDFLTERFLSFELPHSPRDGSFIVEIPNIEGENEFKRVVLAILPNELRSCHPLLRRRNVTVRFVSRLEEKNDPSGKKDSYGDCLVLTTGKAKTEYLVRVVLNLADDESAIAAMVGIILHEIAETDYYLKSPRGTTDSNELLGTSGYFYTEDEEVANRRTIRAIHKIYPQAEWMDVVYPQDE